MIILAGTLTVEPADRDRMMELLTPMVAASRAETGCQGYNFSLDPYDSSVVHLFEVWDDQGALDRHGESQHMAAWRAAASEVSLTGRQLTKYEVANSAPHA